MVENEEDEEQEAEAYSSFRSLVSKPADFDTDLQTKREAGEISETPDVKEEVVLEG